MATGKSRPSLREAQRAVTEQRIIDALVDLIDQEHPLEISMTAVARRAGVSEPTLYRHFPTKRHLFAGLARHQFQAVTVGLAPASADDLADAVRVVFERSAGMEHSIRWTLAAPDPEGVPRPNVDARLSMLRAALGSPAEEDGDAAQFLLCTVLLLTSPMAWLYWKDYLGLEPADAAAAAGWAIKTLASPAAQAHHKPAHTNRSSPSKRTGTPRLS
ncbi:MAG TPA: TetR/AcrR family transcriptional regulator [Streptosporangiaceae bacterium]|nr:TetR/AcrR family transcriptional regulator [Streptosporangiaceae bacterium]